jgi:hypothetical protein
LYGKNINHNALNTCILKILHTPFIQKIKLPSQLGHQLHKIGESDYLTITTEDLIQIWDKDLKLVVDRRLNLKVNIVESVVDDSNMIYIMFNQYSTKDILFIKFDRNFDIKAKFVPERPPINSSNGLNFLFRYRKKNFYVYANSRIHIFDSNF